MKTFKFTFVLAIFALLGGLNSAKAQKSVLYYDQEVSQKIFFMGDPSGTKVYINGKMSGIAPGVVSVKKKIHVPFYSKKQVSAAIQEVTTEATLYVQLQKNGYIVKDFVITPTVSYTKKDGLSVTYPHEVPYTLQEYAPTSDGDTTIRAGESRKAVSRDNPGGTALERTIVRWYFESEPQGARIFWRVISSCPDEVKNTNESWLGTTPFEETRSFNIPGLTYENSRDVQIEIKVHRNGYYDQTKRFNVRQAIDQQEISSFFDMIKVDDYE